MIVQSAVFLICLVVVVMRFTQLAERREQAWSQERSELLNRIQRPELIPVKTTSHEPRPVRERDGLHKVGRIEVDE
jgi:hypothetical protein